MPKRPTKRETKRPAPYNLRAPPSIQTSTTMATALTSPITPWTPHSHQGMWPDPHMGYHPQQHQHQQPIMQNYMPMTAHPPPQQAQAQSHPGQSAPWTSEEDSALMDAKSAGLGWNEIHQRYFPTKSGNACRKRHERLMVKLRTTDWDNNRIQRVMSEYNAPRVREDFWGRIAQRTGERWEDVERVCFQQGLKGLRNTAASHSRSRSRASSGPGLTSEYDHGSSHGDYDTKYDHHDDSGIDLGASGHSRRSSQVVQPNIVPLGQMLRPPSGGYEFP